VTDGTEGGPLEAESVNQKHDELRCRRCGTEMLLAAVASRGRALFRCIVCGSYDLVKA
jgi:DNA-directed RNA polymerase subunit RPC12/RpoP